MVKYGREFHFQMKKKKFIYGLALTLWLSFTAFANADSAQAADMHRLYNKNSGEHFYTANNNEKNHLVKVGWKYEGLGWTTPASGAPVYRLYNANAGDHHYTLNANEKNNLVKVGWKYEGVGWYSDTKKAVPLYRAYNPNARAGSHNYTTNYAEQKNLLRVGWRNEGIAWYGVKKTTTPTPKPVAKYTITVKHVGSDGKTLKSSTTNVEKGKKYTANSASFSGYTLKGNKSQTITVSKNQTITFNYTKNAQKVDKTELIKVYNDLIKNTVLSDYTQNSQVDFNQGTGSVKMYYIDYEHVTQADVDRALQSLKNIKSKMVYIKDLRVKVDAVKNIVKGNYTDTTWNSFNTARTEATNILAKSNATQTEVNNALTKLTNAHAALKVNQVVQKVKLTVYHSNGKGIILKTETFEAEKGKNFTVNPIKISGFEPVDSKPRTVMMNEDKYIDIYYRPLQLSESEIKIEQDKVSQSATNMWSDYRDAKGKTHATTQAQLQVASNIRAKELAVDYSHTRPNGVDFGGYNEVTGAEGTPLSEETGYIIKKPYPPIPGAFTVSRDITGEIIAMVSDVDLEWIQKYGATYAIESWKKSPDHNYIMLLNDDTGKFNQISVGTYIESNGNGFYNVYYCGLLGFHVK